MGVIGLLLAVVRTWRPPTMSLSTFEQKRRAEAGDAAAQRARLYERFEAEIAGGIWLAQVVVVMILVTIALVLLGPALGAAVSLSVIMVGHMAARLPPVAQIGQYTCTRYVDAIVRAAGRFPWLRVVLWAPTRTAPPQQVVHSTEELEYLVKHLGKQVVSPQQKALLLASLAFDAKTAGQVMTPRRQLATISPDELLGPLIVSELHQTGQQWFLVTATDTDTVVGVIELGQLTDVRSGQTPRAADMMQRDIERVTDTQSLRAVLDQLLANNAMMALVTDSSHTVVGMVTMRTGLTALLDT